MKVKLWKIAAAGIIILNCAWSKKPAPCEMCDTAIAIYQKVESTRLAYLDKKEEHQQQNVIAGAFEEMKQFELAQGEAYRFVCDLDKNTYNNREKEALLNLVMKLNDLDINSDAMSDINGCFAQKVKRAKKAYEQIATNNGLENQLTDFMALHGKRKNQDTVKK